MLAVLIPVVMVVVTVILEATNPRNAGMTLKDWLPLGS
jgi:hypothetical protein